MKRISIILAALVIALFMVGTAAALNRVPVPPQEEYFTEISSAQGTGQFHIEKTVIDKDLALEVHELLIGNGDFAMESKEKLNESAHYCMPDKNWTCPCEQGDEPCACCLHRPANYYHSKMIQFDNGFMTGGESFESLAMHGGTGAKVVEMIDGVTALQEQKEVSIDTTVPVGYKQSLDFDTMVNFDGTWGTHSTWKKPCKKDIEHYQYFNGTFAVQKNLIFDEDVIPCSNKKDC
ncbi:MAG: hypothetical protein IMF19_15840 [Proteobacteria bacterium]|nr:hypothetical protein [Pseudomonadota bacterium]